MAHKDFITYCWDASFTLFLQELCQIMSAPVSDEIIFTDTFEPQRQKTYLRKCAPSEDSDRAV